MGLVSLILAKKQMVAKHSALETKLTQRLILAKKQMVAKRRRN